MKEIDKIISKEELNIFFNKYNRSYYADNVEKLIKEMLKKMTFQIKILNASIQFTKEKTAFAVCGFRRSKGYFFVEFFNEESINNERIIREIKVAVEAQALEKEYIISRVEIKEEKDIDGELIKWIIKSWELF